MNREEYRRIKVFLNAWDKGNKIGVTMADRTRLIDGKENISPIQYYESNSLVINDEYLEFRLALMRGEEIEFRDLKNIGWWKTMTGLRSNSNFESEPENYRIKKPDISWVEDGAFCRDKLSGKVHKLYTDEKRNVWLEGCTAIGIDAFIGIYEKWKPKSGDVCWFWDEWINDKDDECPFVGTYDRMNDDDYYICAENGRSTGYCMPYIGDEFWKAK